MSPGKSAGMRVISCALAVVLWSPHGLQAAAVDVDQRSYNPFRTGVNASQVTLIPATVKSGANQFHKRFVLPVDGIRRLESHSEYSAHTCRVHNLS